MQPCGNVHCKMGVWIHVFCLLPLLAPGLDVDRHSNNAPSPSLSPCLCLFIVLVVCEVEVCEVGVCEVGVCEGGVWLGGG